MAEGGILFGGSLIVDQVKAIDTHPEKGRLAVIRGVSVGIGGMACNDPVNLKVLDPELSVATMGRVGEDDQGRYILSEFEAKGVDTSCVIVTPGVNTSFTDVMSDRSDGSRTFFHSYGACALWGFDDIPFERLAGRYSFVQLGYALLLEKMDSEDKEYGTEMARALAKFQEMGLRTAVDVVSEQGERFRKVVGPVLPHVDDFIVNEVEAAEVAGVPTRDGEGRLDLNALEEAAKRLYGMGVKRNVAIHAPEGALWAMRDGGMVFQPSHDIKAGEISGSAGAGDAFCSGVIYGINKGWEPQETLRLATAMAGLCLFSPTTTGGAKPLEEVLEFAESRPYRDRP